MRKPAKNLLNQDNSESARASATDLRVFRIYDQAKPPEARALKSLLKAIGRAFSKPSIYYQLAPHGGIRPAPRRRSRLALTLSEREGISRGIAMAQSARSMARLLGRSPSTVSRELSRNGGYDRYRAALADETAWAQARRPKRCKLANNARLRQAVASKSRPQRDRRGSRLLFISGRLIFPSHHCCSAGTLTTIGSQA
jgi:hypothetical protein